MIIDYTKHLESRTPFKQLSIALNERKDNINYELIHGEKLKLLEKFMSQPNAVLKFHEYEQLFELAAITTQLWEQNKTLKIYFIGGTPLINSVLTTAQEWSNYCNIKFIQTNDRNESDLRVSFDNGDGCWSYIGTAAKGVSIDEATINFGDLKNTTPDEKMEFKRIVLHEFGHALGLIHEHQSPAIQMDWHFYNVYYYCNLWYGWDRSKVNANIISGYNSTDIKFSQVDSLSIMGYYVPKFFTHSQIEFPLNYDLSDRDKSFIGTLYPKVTLIKS